MGTDRHYQLRHAAGRYWLLDMQQEGLDYRKPVVLNECAAFIWKRNDQESRRNRLRRNFRKHTEFPWNRRWRIHSSLFKV